MNFMLSVLALVQVAWIIYVLLVHFNQKRMCLSEEVVIKNKSLRMILEIMEDIEHWDYDTLLCEQNALNGIQRIMRMHTTHPILDGISLIYFIKKNESDDDPQFGSTKIDWCYHCCLGFRDLHVDRDWFIDLSYREMVNDSNPLKTIRLIPKEHYISNIPPTVNAYVIPLKNLIYFSGLFQQTSELMPFQDVDDFLGGPNRTCIVWIFHTPNQKSVKFMTNHSLIFKFENMTTFKLPTKHLKKDRCRKLTEDGWHECQL